MSILSILFNPHRKPETASSIERPGQVIQEGFSYVGGTVYIGGGVQVDANLKNVHVVATDDKPLVLSALGKMDGCIIDAHDVLICGDFSGEVRAKGDCEISATASARGTVLVRGHALISPLAGDSDEIRVGRLPDDYGQDTGAVAAKEAASAGVAAEGGDGAQVNIVASQVGDGGVPTDGDVSVPVLTESVDVQRPSDAA